MSSRQKKMKVNDDLINEILEYDENFSSLSEFDDSDEDETYNHSGVLQTLTSLKMVNY